MPSEGRIFAFFCSERDHKPQNSGCGYTAQSFHTAWTHSGGRRSKLFALRDASDASLLDHLVGGRQQSFRDGKAERLGGFEVDDKLNFRSLLDRQIGWLVAFENAPSIDAKLVVAEAAAI